MSECAVCTIVTKSHLAYARVLAQTLRAHNPGATLVVLLADRVEGFFEPAEEPFRVVQLHELAAQDAVERMSFYYSQRELSFALRGLFHQYMLERTSHEAWVFLDSDIMICGSLQPLFDQLSRASILLNPHRTHPAQQSDIDPAELNQLRTGVYNGGCLGLRRTDEARRFVDWFASRLERYAFDDHAVAQERGMFGDQLWLNLVPLYFSDVGLCRHPGVNVGHWALGERTLTRDDGGAVRCNGELLLFVHFSGWDVAQPTRVSRFTPAEGQNVQPIWSELGVRYRELLLKNGLEATSRLPYAFANFSNGQPIEMSHRKHYYDAVVAGTTSNLPPFFRAEVGRKPGILARWRTPTQ